MVPQGAPWTTSRIPSRDPWDVTWPPAVSNEVGQLEEPRPAGASVLWPGQQVSALHSLIAVAQLAVIAVLMGTAFSGALPLVAGFAAQAALAAAATGARPGPPEGASVMVALASPHPSVMAPAIVPAPGASVGATSKPPLGRSILSVEGRGTYRSPPFTASHGWMLEWHHPGDGLFALWVIPAGAGGLGEEVTASVGSSEGTRQVDKAGSFILEVGTTGAWAVTVRELVGLAETPLPAVLSGSGSSTTLLLRTEWAWVLEWQLDSPTPFRVELVPSNAGRTGGPQVLVDTTGTEGGCTRVSFAGPFYLQVVTEATWTLHLADVDGEIVCPYPPSR
jgi:hypothetical protein